MLSCQHYNLSDVNTSPEPLDRLFSILQQTLNHDLTRGEFMQYLFCAYPDCLEITFIREGEELAGFCTAAAYPQRCNGKKMVVLRSAFGLREKYKNGNFPLHGLFFKYMRYKLTHLLTPVYVAGFMANPLMYAMICRYTLRCYPRRGKQVPQHIATLKEHLLSAQKLKETATPFVTRIHFQVQLSPQDHRRVDGSTDPHVRHFLSLNPDYRQQMGVLVIVPVTLMNMLYTLLRYLYRTIYKTIRHSFTGKQKHCCQSQWCQTAQQ